MNAIYAVYSCPLYGVRKYVAAGWKAGGVKAMFSSLVHNIRPRRIQFKHIKLKGRAKVESRILFGRLLGKQEILFRSNISRIKYPCY